MAVCKSVTRWKLLERKVQPDGKILIGRSVRRLVGQV